MSEKSPATLDYRDVVFVLHIFYQDSIQDFRAIWQLHPDAMFFVSTPNEQVFDDLSKDETFNSDSWRVVLTQNLGRNFGPLLVEFGTEVLNYKYLVHLHSKKSPQMSRNTMRLWRDRIWDPLAKQELLQRALHIMEGDSRVNLIYGYVGDIVRGINFRWGESLSKLPPTLQTHPAVSKSLQQARFAFPAGGMFLARTTSISDLLKFNWTWSDFPREYGQLDGTAQHGVERFIGAVADHTDESLVCYLAAEDFFTADKSYLG